MPSFPKENNNPQTISVQKWQPPALADCNSQTGNQPEKEIYQATVKLDDKFTNLVDLLKENTSLETRTNSSYIQTKKESQGYYSWQPNELEPLLGVVGNTHDVLHTREAQNRAEAILRDAKEKYNEIIRQAEQAAQMIREQAQQEAQQIQRQAYTDGLAAANAETQSMLMTAKSILEEVQTWKEAMFEQGEMMMLRLVIEIAQTMFGDGLPLDPDTLGQTFSRALNQAKTLGNLRIYVHPEDAAVLSAHWNKLQGAIGGQQVELIPSEVIKRGGCYIDGQFGSVDARVETQFQNIRDALLTSFEKSKSGVVV
ncbi:MAG: FliH/SctL family protein [Anaerolineales bacterium]